ncbi:MAG: cytochrome c [Acidobacteriaceae bacterium]
MITKGIIAFSLTVAASALLAAPPQTPTASTTSQGVYTTAQAALGHTLYNAKCSSCHLADLTGKDQNPPLVGKDFTSEWTGEPLGGLFDKIENTMPADNPGTLSRDQTAELLAFILSSNKFPAGKTALPTDAQALKQIRITAPPPAPAPNQAPPQTSPQN